MRSDMENKDWMDDYMSLKQVNKNNPFTVPVGYFDDLEARIVLFKNLNELKNNNEFGGLTIPENYFEELAGNIQSRIAIEDSLTAGMGFTVPGNYFDDLTNQIQSRVFVEEALAETDENFTLPEGYFNQLSKNILDKTVNHADAKQGGVIRKLFASTAFKYATAACFALVLGGGILLNELTGSVNEHKNTFLHQELSGVPVDEIKSYLQLNEDAGDTQQSVVAESAPVNDQELKTALQNDVDSVQ
jgi:hypothetical protein